MPATHPFTGLVVIDFTHVLASTCVKSITTSPVKGCVAGMLSSLGFLSEI